MQNYRIKLQSLQEVRTYQLASLSIKQCVCNENLQHQESSASITLNYDADLFKYLATNRELVAQIIDGNDEPLFTGTITVDLSWTDNGKNEEIGKISLTVNDFSSRFNRKTENEILLEQTNLASAVAHFANLCGINVHGTLPDLPIQVVCIAKDKSILSALEALLYQYGFSFYFDANGALDFFDYKNIPQEPTPLTDAQIKTGLQGSKSTKNYTAVSVSFNTLTTKTNELVYFQGNGYDDNDDPAPFYVQPGVYFPYESSPVLEVTDGIVYQSFASSYAEATKKYNGEWDYGRNKNATLLYSKNHYVEPEWDGTITIDRTAFESKQSAVRLKNTGTQDAKVYKLGIRADAVYRDASSTVTIGDTSGSVFTTDFEFVYEMKTAETIAKALFSYFAKGNVKIKFQSQTCFVPGQFFALNTGATGLECTIFVQNRTFDAEKEQYSYEAFSVSDLSFDVKKSSISFSRTDTNAIAAVSNLKQSLNEGKGTPLPDRVTGVKVSAERDALVITCASPQAGLRNTISQYKLQLSRDEGATWVDFSAVRMPVEYAFIRDKSLENSDGYPEESDLLLYRVRIKAENVYGNLSEDWSEVALPNTSNYGTWILSAPQIAPSVSHRSVMLRFSQPALSSGKERYGTIKHRIEIRRTDIDGNNEWFKPNEVDDPNENELFYKAQNALPNPSAGYKTGSIETASDYSQTLPLAGQNEETPAPTYTTYQYRVTALNECGLSDASTVTCVARPTSVVDVVRGWEYNEQGEKVKVPGALGAENIYAEELSAISVNLGSINAGILQSDIEAGETKPNVLLDLDGQEFRVGNSPTLEDLDSAEAEYLHYKKGRGLYMKMKNFVLDAIGSLVKGVMTVISVTDETRRAIISNTGMKIQKLVGDEWNTSGRMTVDEYGNTLMGNADEDSMPKIVAKIADDTAFIYQFNVDKNDQRGLNEANLNITGDFTEDYGDGNDAPVENARYLSDYIIPKGTPKNPPYTQSLLSKLDADAVLIPVQTNATCKKVVEGSILNADMWWAFVPKSTPDIKDYTDEENDRLCLYQKAFDETIGETTEIVKTFNIPQNIFCTQDLLSLRIVVASTNALFVADDLTDEELTATAPLGTVQALVFICNGTFTRMSAFIGTEQKAHFFADGDNLCAFVPYLNLQTEQVENIAENGDVTQSYTVTITHTLASFASTDFVPINYLVQTSITHTDVLSLQDVQTLPALSLSIFFDTNAIDGAFVYLLLQDKSILRFTKDSVLASSSPLSAVLPVEQFVANTSAISADARLFRDSADDKPLYLLASLADDVRTIYDTGIYSRIDVYKQGTTSRVVASITELTQTEDDVTITKYKAVLQAQAKSRYMCWLRGTVNICGISLPCPVDEYTWYFASIYLDASVNQAHYAFYSYTGTLLLSHSFTLEEQENLDLCKDTLSFTGDIQNLAIDNGTVITRVNIDVDTLIMSHKHAETDRMTGIDVTKRNLVFNVADPDAVSSNCFVTKKEGTAPPVGSFYRQLPPFTYGGKTYTPPTPDVLYPNTTWVNVSSSFAGRFFRVEGGDAATFGTAQASANLSHTHTSSAPRGSLPLGLKSNNYQNGSIANANNYGYAYPYALNSSGTTEARPINYAIRLWYRTE